MADAQAHWQEQQRQLAMVRENPKFQAIVADALAALEYYRRRLETAPEQVSGIFVKHLIRMWESDKLNDICAGVDTPK